MLEEYLDYSITIILILYLIHHIIFAWNSMNKSIDKNAKFVESYASIFTIGTIIHILWSIVGIYSFTIRKLFTQEFNLNNTKLPLKLLGLFLFVAGILIRKWSIKTLGRFFTYRVAILEEHKLIQEGPYYYLIHPSYTGIIMMLLGYHAYTQNSSYFTGISIVIEIFLFFYRIRLEEKVLKEKFKDEWEQHIKTKKRIIPFVI